MKPWKFILAGILCLSQASLAQIGSDNSAIDLAAKAPGAVRLNTVSKAKFDVHGIKMASHLIQYYVSKDNKIFCESWNGLTHPDLSEALGPYYNEYKTAFLSSRKKGLRHHIVSTSNIYVERHGMMRNIKGRACVLKYKPSNVTLDEIK